MNKSTLLSLYDVLWNVAELIKPRSYLEIGFREGASLMSAIAQEREVVNFIETVNLADIRVKMTPKLLKQIHQRFTVRSEIENIVICDNLEQTPHRTGTDHINDLLKKGFEYSGKSEVIIGDSRECIPSYLEDKQDLVFDLVLIDGGHELEVVEEDLKNVVDHFKVLVCHDINHYQLVGARAGIQRIPSSEYAHMRQTVESYAYQNGYAMTRVGQRRFGTAVLFNWRRRST